MATPPQVEDMLDIANNPFIDWSSREPIREPTQWATDTEAGRKVYSRIRKEIKYFATMMKGLEEEGLAGGEAWNYACTEIVRWNDFLILAQYN